MPDLRPLTSTDLATGTKENVAARLAAADARARLGLEAPQPGNIITKNAARPLSASLDALQAKINAQSRNPFANTVVQAASAVTAPVFAPTPRRIAPGFDVTQPQTPAVTAVGGNQATSAVGAPAESGEVPWWRQRGVSGQDRGTFYGPANLTGTDSAQGRATARDANAVIVGYNGRVIPKVVNANESMKSEVEKQLGY